MLLYSLLHLTGYDMPIAELQQFRQWGSKTPGHPEHWLVPGIETTTGPLGQGFGNGVGMAIAQKYLAAHFNRPGHEIVDYKIYAIAGDGCLMEGISSEAASLAGHLQLDNLIYFYDDNHISIEGNTQLAFTEDRAKRFEAYGWFVQKVERWKRFGRHRRGRFAPPRRSADGRRSSWFARTLVTAAPTSKTPPRRTARALGVEEVKLTKQNLGWPLEPAFLVPDEARAHFRLALAKGAKAEAEWQGQAGGLPPGVSGPRGGMGPIHAGRIAAGLAGEDSHLQPYRQADGDAAGVGQGFERHFPRSSHFAGRLGGLGAFHRHSDQG